LTPLTELLQAAQRGEPQAAAGLLPLVYEELRKLAMIRLSKEHAGHSLNATALVHEAYLRLIGDQLFEGRGHFFGAAAEAMRRILVDQARRRKSLKRGGDAERIDLAELTIEAPSPDEELLALHEALDTFEKDYPEHAQLVKLRYFAGLSADEAAALLGISPSTADRRWTFARAWLKRAVSA